MGLPIEKNEHLTYKDYLTWDDEERWELIDGEAFSMSPAPSANHQRVLRELSMIIHNFLKGKPCEMFFAPFDVCFVKEGQAAEDSGTLLQPDLSVICDSSKIKDQGCVGAPDFVIEIVSPSSIKHDGTRKRDVYEQYGVKEFWLVRPLEASIEVFLLGEGGKFQTPRLYAIDEVFEVHSFPGLKIDLKDVF